MTKRASTLFVACFIVTCTFTGCAQLKNRLGFSNPVDENCGPEGCHVESDVDNVESDTPSFPTSTFQPGSGSDVFGGNMSSPARGFRGGFGG